MKTLIPTLALALIVSCTCTAPAEAGLTEGQKCAMKAYLLSGKFSLCLSKADANVAKAKAADTAAADLKCEDKFRSGWGRTWWNDIGLCADYREYDCFRGGLCGVDGANGGDFIDHNIFDRTCMNDSTESYMWAVGTNFYNSESSEVDNNIGQYCVGFNNG